MVTITKAISCVFTKERKDIIIEGRVRKLRMCNREESGFSPPPPIFWDRFTWIWGCICEFIVQLVDLAGNKIYVCVGNLCVYTVCCPRKTAYKGARSISDPPLHLSANLPASLTLSFLLYIP